MSATLAETYRTKHPPDYSDFSEWVLFVADIDPGARLRKDDLGACVFFTDGSFHRLGNGPSPDAPVLSVLR